MENIKLPKDLEQDPSYHQIYQLLNSANQQLWKEGDLKVVSLPFDLSVKEGLMLAKIQDNLIRGYETIEKLLANEDKGLALLKNNSSSLKQERISRIAFITNDGSDRFYRHIESLLRKYRNRLLVFFVECDSLTLGSHLSGQSSSVKIVLIKHKSMVIKMLKILVKNWLSNQKKIDG